MSEEERKPDVQSTPPKKRKQPAGNTDSPSPSKHRKTHGTGQLPPPGFTGTVLPANHPTVIYEILERAIEEATPEHRKIVAERYGIEAKTLHYAWRTIKKNALNAFKGGL
ncbi:hypothetical protein FFLO_05662 [Filobasidium floriforme]|uniref:Uncharacterized protein n=1 Tax=Filobasidium floriforme TaxID=5210 RepID=A0A8K0JGH8_9TREE|nr:uncharacterized protein HD553DRAFT_337318 [Filobasidium floriforme]KAG7529434.1 hypothetical protein FFLO_05662 [Filobasidium floriforme]KAH8079310.1 hypothetical protein HD553DRAFT_337318 [Filobasidium floriforme]